MQIRLTGDKCDGGIQYVACHARAFPCVRACSTDYKIEYVTGIWFGAKPER